MHEPLKFIIKNEHIITVISDLVMVKIPLTLKPQTYFGPPALYCGPCNGNVNKPFNAYILLYT